MKSNVKHKGIPRGTRKQGPRTKDGARRQDKAEFQGPQHLRRYAQRHGAA